MKPPAKAPPRLCGVCVARVPPLFRAPAPESAPDLDMRPSEPARSTLDRWIAVCRACGAAAPDLAALPAEAGEIVRSPAYADCAGSPETLPFRRWAMLSPTPDDAADALLQAAWVAEDAALDTEAAALRSEAAARWAETKQLDRACRRLDALRRAKDFDAATTWLTEVRTRPLDEVSAAVVTFQADRIAARDSARYLMSAALRPPAHAPHVSHGKRAPSRGGWFSRLLGR